jgi:hypothetical protein
MTNGGGWTIFSGPQENGSSINAVFADYEHGFGTLANEDFWLGLSFLSGETNVRN